MHISHKASLSDICLGFLPYAVPSLTLGCQLWWKAGKSKENALYFVSKITSVCFQVSIRLDGENKALEYNAVGLTKDAVRVVFRNERVSDLFDRSWHKIALSIQSKAVSLYIDCKLVQVLPIEDRENIDIQGKTVIGKRLYDSVPIDVSTACAG